MTKADVIANASANNATEEEIAILENTSEDEFGLGKDTDVATGDAAVASESIVSESTGLLEPIVKKKTTKQTSEEQKNHERHFNNGTLETGDPYKNFLISPDFFGDPLKTKTTINEEEAKVLLDKKLKGLGIDVEEIMPAKDVLQIGGEEGEIVPLTRGLGNVIKSLWGKDTGYTNEDRVNIVNEIIQGQVDLLTDPNSEEYDENFDFDIHVNAYQIAQNTPTQPGSEFPLLDFRDLDLDDQVIHTYRVRNAIFEDFWRSDKGKQAKIDIEKELSIANAEIANTIFTNANMESENFWYLATVEYDTMLKQAKEDILLNNKDYQAVTQATDDVLYGLFSKDLEEKSIQEKREEEFGSIVANNKVLSGIFKGALNYQLATTSMIAGSNASHYELETIMLSDIENMDDDEMYKIPFEQMRRLESWKLPNELRIPGKVSGYKVGDLKSILRNRIQFHQVKALNAFMESNILQERLASITSSDSQLWKDGKLNVTGNNWKEAIGEQGFNMLVSILGAGFPTFVMEAGGAYNEMLEGSAMAWAKKQGLDWENLSVDDKTRIYFEVIDQGKIDFGAATQVGVTSMFLENLSNYVFVSKGLKPLSQELGDAWTIMMKGKYKHAINLTGQSVKSAGGEMTAVTVVETFTESLQDGFSQYKVSSALGDPSYSWDQGINVALTTVLTAPVIVASGKTVSTFTNALISQVTRLNTSEQMKLALKNNRTQILLDWTNGKITEKEKNERLLIADAVDTGILKEDRMLEDPQAVENVIRLEMEAYKKLKAHRELEAKKKELKEQLKDNYTDEMAQADDQELAILANEYFDFKKEQQKHRYLDEYRVNQIVKAEEFNTGKMLDSDGNPLSEKWDLSIVKNNEGIENILESIGIKLPRKKDGTIDQRNLEGVFKNLFENGANEMVLTPETIRMFNPNYDGKGVVLISDENIEANIMAGDMYASTSVAHGIEHVLFNENYSSKEGITKLQNLQVGLDLLTKSSTDETVLGMKMYVDIRMQQYKDQKGSKTYLEEYFNAWGDVSKALSLNPNINSETRKIITQVGEEINSMLHPGEKSNFDFDNTIEFLSSRLPVGEIKTVSYLAENGKDVIVAPVAFSLAEEVSTKGDARSDMKLIDDTNPYSLNRSPEEIAAENKEIGDLIKKHKNFVHEDKTLQERVRTEGVRKYQQDLMYNNWGAFKNLINKNYNREHEMHSDINEEIFIGDAMEQFVQATSTYDPNVSDAFGAYFFGEGGARNPATGAPILHPITGKPMSVAEARLQKIWGRMETQFTEQIEEAKYEGDDTTLDVMQIVEDYNERSVLRESIPGFEENTPTYDSWIAEQTKAMSDPNFDWVAFMTDPDALSKLDKKGKSFYKLLKKSFKDKTYKNYNHTQEYIDYVIKNAELIYNQMDQTTMNMTYGEFTEVDPDADVSPITGRLTVPGSQKKKQKEVKSKTAGNIPRRKLKWNEDVEAAFIERLLKLDEIAELKRQGLSPSEIHKIVRVDMLQEATFSQMSKILFRDAMMQTVTTDEFKATNGIDNSEISRMALLVDKGIDVKFSLRGKVEVLSGKHSFGQVMQWAGEIQRTVKPEYKADTEWEAINGIINSELFDHIPQDVKNMVSAEYEQDHVEFAEQALFTYEMKRNDLIDQKVRDEAGKNIRNDADTRQAMVDNAEIIIEALNEIDPQLLAEYTKLTNNSLELFGFHYRGLDAAKEKRDGTPGEHYESHKKLLKLILEGEGEGDARIYNKDVPLSRGGVFAKLIKILESDKTKKVKLEEIESSGLLEEIKNANVANINNFKTVIKVIADKVQKGEVDEAGIIQMLKMQSGLTFALRGWSRLDGYLVADGVQNINWKGEHAASMSKVDTEVLDLIYRYKKDSTIDLDGELDIILAGYGQVLGDATHMDALDEFGRTNISDTYRFNMWDYKTAANYVDVHGGDLKDMQSRIILDRERKIRIYQTKKKAAAIENINLKNTTKGKIKGTSIMDFDRTIHEDMPGESTVIFATKDGVTEEITAGDWPNVGEQMIKDGWTMDFSEFDKVNKGKAGPLMQKLKNQIEKYGVKDVYILTARSSKAAEAIQQWLKSHGIDLPLENITGLGNSTGQAKADWIENLILDGYNDIYFVDDAVSNVKAVQDMFDKYPPGVLVEGGKAVLVNPLEYNDKGVKFSLSDTFNNIIESSTGIEEFKTFSEAEGKIRGKVGGTFWDVLYPASAYDLELFTYRYIGKGKDGENQKLFFEEKLFKPFALATNEINKDRQRLSDDKKVLYKNFKDVKGDLNSIIEGTNFTKEQAIRVYLWNKNGIDIPGLSPTAKAKLLSVVEGDQRLIEFADNLGIISRQEGGYVSPTEYWTVENIEYDLQQITNEGGRSKYLVEWKNNVDQIFSKENKNKLRAAYGNKHVEALEDMLYRMEYGKNRQKPGRIERSWNNWVNNSVGAIMFFNMRSAVLQTISAANYVDYGDNNIIQAGKRLANFPQFTKDFAYIFNSDYLRQRRGGQQRGINEAELSAYVSGKDNKAKAIIAFMLEKGFLPTQIADSFAIASGGATFYRSKVIAYEKQGMSTKEAEDKAWLDFQERTEKNQQSSRADLISQQQAGGLGRILLAFGNTPMQYNRIIIKSALDLKNNRGPAMENIGKIAYYGAVQNAIFTTLQTAVWAAFGEDEEEWDKKTDRAANQMVDGLLTGMGLTGVVFKTAKNSYLEWRDQRARGYNADHAQTIIEFANMSPTIGSKLRKLYGAIRTEQMNQEAIDEMGFDINSPAMNAIANLISATTNIPVDRAIQKTQNILLASKSETEVQDKMALLLGWNPWDLGIESEARKVQKKAKVKKVKEQDVIKKQEQEVEDVNKTEILIKQEKQQDQYRTDKQKKSKTYYCPNVHNGVRCGNIVEKAGQRCTVHQKVEQRIDGKEVKCKGKRTNGEPCNMMTTAKSGYCVYHD